MKNYERYADKIREYEGETFCSDFIQPYILKQSGCSGMNCGQCNMISLIWLMKEYEEPQEEPQVDWSKVEVDTPILVRINEDKEWERRYFAKYENGVVYAWNSGCTSWTTHCMTTCMTPWKFAKLAEGEKECKELEVDWNEVNVDTPILVGEGDGDWVKRYFAEYKDGIVYAWCGGSTSWDANNMMMSWKYAKLAEDEETK